MQERIKYYDFANGRFGSVAAAQTISLERLLSSAHRPFASGKNWPVFFAHIESGRSQFTQFNTGARTSILIGEAEGGILC